MNLSFFLTSYTIFVQLACLSPNKETSKSEISKIIDDRDSLRVKVTDLKQEKHAMQDKLASANKTIDALRLNTPMNQQISELQVSTSAIWKIAAVSECFLQ